MICVQCGNQTSVIGTRCPTKPGRGAEVNKASKVVAWYTSDFVVRLRRCKACNTKGMTVELPIEDIVAMIRESSEGHAPDELLQRKT
jgi:hypothetical protein